MASVARDIVGKRRLKKENHLIREKNVGGPSIENLSEFFEFP